MSRLCLQFIDDIFLWMRTLGELMKLKQEINKVQPSVKFDFSFFFIAR